MNKWIIIEDTPSKAQQLIANIFYLCHDVPEIIWFYPQKDIKNTPQYLENINEEDSTAFFSFDMENANGNIEQLKGSLKFCWCKDEEKFDHLFNLVDTSESILLLDFNLSALGTRKGDLHPNLVSKAQHILTSQKALVVFITNTVSHRLTRITISEGDQRIISFGDKDYDKIIQADCYEIIKGSISFWEDLFGYAKFDLNQFFDKMKTVTIEDGHNWSLMDSIYTRDNKNHLWNHEWNLPCQVVWLSQFLKYKDFADDFLRDINGNLKRQTAVQECLKTMATKDSESFSVLAVFFICWAAYRKQFKNDKKNQLFKNALLSLDKPNQNFSEISRNSMITPPQSFERLKETGNLLYDMMYILLKNKKDGESNLMEVQIDDMSLAFKLRIAAEDLNRVLQEKYENQILNPFESKISTGGDATTAILKFFRQVQFSDGSLQDEKPFLGSDFNFKIINTKQGVIKIQFG